MIDVAPVSVVVLANNQAENLPDMLDRSAGCLQANFADWELIVVGGDIFKLLPVDTSYSIRVDGVSRYATNLTGGWGEAELPLTIP